MITVSPAQRGYEGRMGFVGDWRRAEGAGLARSRAAAMRRQPVIGLTQHRRIWTTCWLVIRDRPPVAQLLLRRGTGSPNGTLVRGLGGDRRQSAPSRS